MSLLKKINNFINFSVQRNFDSGVDIDATIKAKKEALAKRDSGESAPVEEPKVEETAVAEPDSVEKIRQEVLTPINAPKMELKTKSALDRQKAELAALKSQVSEKKEEIAQTEDEVKAEEKQTKDAEKVAEAEKVIEDTTNEELAENAVAEEQPEGTTEDVVTETEPTEATTEEVAQPESTPGTGGEVAAEAAAAAKAEADAKAAQEPNYDGAKVADANGKTHTIVKRADGYYIKGTNSKVLDAEGNPTSKYRTLGNALKNGQSVSDYVKSKGGWAKYNKELKSNSNG